MVAREKRSEQMTLEQIDNFLDALMEKGRSPGSLQSYRGILTSLYEYLPEGKRLNADTGAEWKDWLEEQGFSQRTVNARLSAWNSFLQYLGHREWQTDDFNHTHHDVQPELTRAEYLRLLSAARQLDKEKSYLLIKTMGGAGMRIQELPQLTVEAVAEGSVKLERHNHTQRRILYLPPILREELMDYIRREQLESGSVFVTQEGTPLKRSSVYYYVNCVCRDAQVDEEKANPRCLWKMHQNTYDRIRANVNILVEQTYQRILEEEQFAVGWNN